MCVCLFTQLHMCVCLLHSCTCVCVYCTAAHVCVSIAQLHMCVCLLHSCTCVCVYLHSCTCVCVYCTAAHVCVSIYMSHIILMQSYFIQQYCIPTEQNLVEACNQTLALCTAGLAKIDQNTSASIR